MKIPRWDRIYYFVYFATLFALASFAALFVVPLVEITDIETGEITTLTIPDNGQWDIVWLSVLPVVIPAMTLLAVPRQDKPDRTAKINIWISTFLVYTFVIMMIFVNGVLFIPTAMMMTAAAVGSQVTRKERTIFAKSPSESMAGRGGGKRRRNKR